MADITFLQKPKIERVFEMQSGYVLDFSNNSFRDFMAEVASIDIYDDKYEHHSGSKANRLRRFFEIESNYLAGKAIIGLLEYRENLSDYLNSWKKNASSDEIDFVHNLGKALIEDHGYVIPQLIDDSNFHDSFKLLKKSIEEFIKNNDPVSGVDRLHTYMVEYIRLKCDKLHIQYDQHESLNAIYGKLVNIYDSQNLIKTPMALRVLKTSISNLDAFNKVRNDHSLAHGNNDILGREEAKFIFNNIICLINFIESIHPEEPENVEQNFDIGDDLPF
jgi:hypothetical protein